MWESGEGGGFLSGESRWSCWEIGGGVHSGYGFPIFGVQFGWSGDGGWFLQGGVPGRQWKEFSHLKALLGQWRRLGVRNQSIPFFG